MNSSELDHVRALDAVAKGRALLTAGNIDAADDACAEALRRDPSNAEALNLMADVALRRPPNASTLDTLRSGALSHPDRPDLQYKLGCMLDDMGDLDAAAASYTAAVKADPRMAKAHNNLGATQQKLGRLDAALQSFMTARDLDPGLWQIHYNLANLYKQAGELGSAIEPLQQVLRLRRSRGVVDAQFESLFAPTTRSKLLHDIEQRNYLLQNGLLPPSEQTGIDALQIALEELEPQFRTAPAVSFPVRLAARAAYNRLVHFYPAPRLLRGAINPRLDTRRIEKDYFDRAPGMTFVDDFLTPDALNELRRFCMESTIWFDCLYKEGYVGSTFDDGFACPLLAQIGEELPRALPGIFGSHRFAHLWGYKYDSDLAGISEHADFAAVNVNFWITPDDANLSPESGGLVVWDKEAPLDWDFEQYNREPARIRQFVAESGASAFTVPYRQNRVVIFNSDLFHKTDHYRFRPGYENRRLNVTYLYGYRQTSEGPGRLSA